jgi:glutaminase
LTPRSFPRGSLVFQAGQPAAELLIILKGKASVVLTLPSGQACRVTTCTPGMTFGEMALLDQAPRSATVRADNAIDALALPLEEFNSLSASEPEIGAKLLANMARQLSARLRQRNAEVVNGHLAPQEA